MTDQPPSLPNAPSRPTHAQMTSPLSASDTQPSLHLFTHAYCNKRIPECPSSLACNTHLKLPTVTDNLIQPFKRTPSCSLSNWLPLPSNDQHRQAWKPPTTLAKMVSHQSACLNALPRPTHAHIIYHLSSSDTQPSFYYSRLKKKDSRMPM